MGEEERDVDLSRRANLNALLGVLGGAVGLAALTGCQEGAGVSTELVGVAKEAVTGTSLEWADTIGTAVSPGDLRGITGSTTLHTVVAGGFWSIGDGGGGVFHWDPNSSATDDGGTIINPTGNSGSGRWRRIFSGALNVKWFGARGDGSAQDSALQAAIGAAKTLSTDLEFPPGTYSYSSAAPLSFDSTTNVRLRGTSTPVVGTNLQYTGGGSGAAISAQASSGFAIFNMVVSHSSTSFTGTLLRLDGTSSTAPTNLAAFEDVWFSGPSGGTATLVSLKQSYQIEFNRCQFAGCGTAVLGLTSTNDFANGIAFRSCGTSSRTATTYWIRNPGNAWIVDGCTFEPLTNGTANAISCAYQCAGLAVSGCWCGDASGGGTWLNLSASGASIRGNIFGDQDKSSTAVALSASSCGVEVTGNCFQSAATAITFASGNDAILFQGNSFVNVTSIYNALPRTGVVQVNANRNTYSSGAGTQVVSPFRAHVGLYSPQSIPSATSTKVSLTVGGTIDFDPDGDFDNVNHVYTARMPGYYQVNALIQMPALSSGSCQIALFVNGSYSGIAGFPGVRAAQLADVIHLNAGDKLELHAYQDSGSSVSLQYAYMSVHYLSS